MLRATRPVNRYHYYESPRRDPDSLAHTAVRVGGERCDPFVPVFPLIPAYSRSESRNYLDFLRLRSGFEPEGQGVAKWPSATTRSPAELTRESLRACQYLRSSCTELCLAIRRAAQETSWPAPPRAPWVSRSSPPPRSPNPALPGRHVEHRVAFGSTRVNFPPSRPAA